MKTEYYPTEDTDNTTEQNHYVEFTPPPITETADGSTIDVETPFGAEVTARSMGAQAFSAAEIATIQVPFGLDVMQPVKPLPIEAGKLSSRTINTRSNVYNPNTGRTSMGSDDSEQAVIPD